MVKESLERLAHDLRTNEHPQPWAVNITRIGMDMLMKELGIEQEIEEYAGVRLLLDAPKEQGHG